MALPVVAYIEYFFLNYHPYFNPNEGVNNLVSAGTSEAYVVKYDKDGNYLWANRMGGADNDMGLDIAVHASHVYVTGSFESSAEFNARGESSHALTSKGRTDVFIAKYEASGGALSWVKSMGGPKFDEGKSIFVDESGLYVAGRFEDIANFNAVGEEVVSYTSKGYRDIFLAHYSLTEGAYIWSKALGNVSFDEPNAITKNGNSVYVTGSFQETLSFNAEGVADLVSVGNNDVFFMSFQSTIPLVKNIINNKPTLDVVEDPQEILKNADIQRVTLSGISNGGEDGQTVTVTASSDNTALIPNPVVLYSGSESTAILEYKPVLNMTGTAIITVKVMDDGSPAGIMERTFIVTVLEVTSIRENDLSNRVIIWTDYLNKKTWLKSKNGLMNVKLSLLNLNGKIVWGAFAKELKEMHINANQPPGIYILRLEIGQEVTHKKIFIP
ncbi:MAG: T9SS type A sorting domain-containing protein [Bacteroidota bacterium]|nr:T9SS type A sorting domain-containing protein [Bacteroidota bacterium]